MDLSQKRLGEVRCFGTLDDMNNWGGPKYMVGEVDTYKKFPDYDLYGDFNVNYVKLDRVPGFDDWSPISRALRSGAFFVTTGEVLIPRWAVEGEGKDSAVVADVEWTFPLEFVEVVWGDGEQVGRTVISGDDSAAVRVAPIPHPVRFLGEEVGAVLGLGLGGQWSLHAARAPAVGNEGAIPRVLGRLLGHSRCQ